MFRYICAWLQALLGYVNGWLQAAVGDDPHDSACLGAALAIEEDPVTVSLGPMGPLFWQLRSVIAILQDSRGLRLKGVKAEIQILGQGLESLCTDLKDLSEAEDTITRCWVSQARDLLYDTADYLDEAIHYCSGTNPRTRSMTRLLWVSKSKSFRVSARLTWLPLPKVRKLKRATMIAKLSALVARVQDAEERRERFDLSPPQASKRHYTQDAPTFSDIMPQHPPQLHIDRLVEMLALNNRDDNGMEKKVKTLTIFGSADVDKTSIARSLYQQYGGRFEHRAFLRASRDPDARKLLANLLSQIKAPPAHAFSDVKRLTSTIAKHLQGKSYLIIIDDLWDTSTWDIITRALSDGDNCRIITATQIEDVALACCSYQLNHIYEITPLNADHLGKSEGDCTAYPSSEGMKEALNVVYNNLPPHLKTCLLYLNMYLEGYTIRKDELVNQWVAEGFIGSVQGKEMENTAGCYFDALINSGLVQSVDTNHNGEVLSCTLHHTVLDLIRQKSMEENFITIVNYFQTILGLPDKVRRLSVQLGGAKGSNNIPGNMRISQVRSLLFSGFSKCAPSIVHYGLLQVLVLHIWSDKDEILDLPAIGELYRLRYLKIECNITVKLPGNIRRLQHLGTLQVDARLYAVPSGIVHLGKLLHLRLPGESSLPHGVGHMACLRTLGYFDLGRNSEDNVRDLGELKNLQLTCSIGEPAENLEKNMRLLMGSVLQKLSIPRSVTLAPASGSCKGNTPPDYAAASSMSISCDGFSSVSPPPSLQRLELSRHCCIFSRVPKWLGELTQLCILKIAVKEITKEDTDILKGLPALGALSLHVASESSEMIVIGKGGFSVLTYFKFTRTVPWLKFEADAMPNLQKLRLGFNATIVDKQGIIIEYSSGIKEISAVIGCGVVGAEPTWRKALFRNDPRNPKVQWIGSAFHGDQGTEHMVTQEYCITQDNCSGEGQITDETGGIQDEGSEEGEKFDEALRKTQESKKEVFEESTKRRKAETDLLSALEKGKELEKLYHHEIRQRKTIEGTLVRQTQELEERKIMCDTIYDQLRDAQEQKAMLEQRITEMEYALRDGEEKLATSKYLVKALQADNKELQQERDAAVTTAEELRQQLAAEAINTQFSAFELQQATRSFDEALKIGEGGFGCVYKGSLRSTTVAIKLLHPNSLQGLSEFNQEVAVLGRVRHPNLVALMGSCRDTFSLVYEFLPNGNLEDRLACANDTLPLTWQVRTRIIYEMCSALTFLHSNKPHPLVHGDLKPANILLDANLVSKLGDFGISRLMTQSSTSGAATRVHRTAAPRGTFAYMDPEYLSSGELTPRSDVYSFGIIILQLLTGRRPQKITEVVDDAIEKRELHMALDPSAGSWPFVHANQLAHLGLRCAEMSRRRRPDLAREVWTVVEPLMKAASLTTRRPTFAASSERLRRTRPSRRPTSSARYKAGRTERVSRPARGQSWTGPVSPGPISHAFYHCQGHFMQTVRQGRGVRDSGCF